MTGKCHIQLIVEADGSVYPCDFYCLDEYCIGDIKEESLKSLFEKSASSKSKERDDLPQLCKTCSYIKICGGNCKRMQKEMCCMTNDKFCGYKNFLDEVIDELIIVVNRFR
ncbi:MAG: SPASM domain-containing protein [Lachnospirales bacterium]